MLSIELDFATFWKVGSIHLSKGNGKISRNVGVFNLPVVRTCPYAWGCHAYCSGKRAENGWPHVTCARWDNFYASRRSSFVDEMVNRITTTGLMVVRFHEAGDVYHPRYAEDLAQIARRLPDRRFYLYTKSIPYVAALKQVRNFTVIFSFGGARDHLIDRQTDNYARVVDTPSEVQPGEYLCPAVAHAETEDQKICGVLCTYCQGDGHQVRVCFIKELKGKNWTANPRAPPRPTGNSPESAFSLSQQITQPDVSVASEFRCSDVLASVESERSRSARGCEP